MKKNDTGLYIHVPFCVRKCAYCDFYSLPGRSDLAGDYTDALCEHIKAASCRLSEREVDTIFFGGGTPSLLPPEFFKRITSTIFENYNLAKAPEISVEVNPATVNGELIDTYIKCGVNRISIGMQSLDENELKLLSRIHGRRDFYDTCELIRRKGIKNVNVDLMYGIPSQTVSSLEKSLEELTKLEPAHISVYGLKIEPDTCFGKHPDKYNFPDDDTQSDMYLLICSYLRERGYNRYEFSNFAKPGYECRHNLKYWNREEYLGFGPAASSFIDNTRYTYKRDLDGYIKNVMSGKEPGRSETNVLSGQDINNERIMLGMRLEKGIPATDMLIEKCVTHIKLGFIKLIDGRLSFTDKGVLVSNYILSDLID